MLKEMKVDENVIELSSSMALVVMRQSLDAGRLSYNIILLSKQINTAGIEFISTNALPINTTIDK